MGGREDSEKAAMLLDLEASCLALMSTNDVRETVALQELYQRVGTAEGREREKVIVYMYPSIGTIIKAAGLCT